jgi:hypothetical protein
MITVYSENCTKYRYTAWENVEFFNVKVVHIVTTALWRVKLDQMITKRAQK